MTGPRRYRKRAVTVEAQQWFPGVVIQNLRTRYLDGIGHVAWFNDGEGEPRLVRSGNWVIRDNDGELHVVSDRKFHDLFEELPDSPA